MNVEDMKIIDEIGMANLPRILYELHQKYDGKYKLIDIGNDCMFRFGETNVGNVSYLPTILHFVSIQNQKLRIEGSVSIPTVFFSHFDFYVCVDGKFSLCKLRDDGLDAKTENGVYESRNVFCYEVDLSCRNKKISIEFYYVCNGVFCKSRKINSMRFVPMADVLDNQYAYREGWILRIDNASIVCQRSDEKVRQEYEKRFLLAARKNISFGDEEVISIRKEYFKRYKRKKKPIWLFFDRIDKADDNGEAMFRYVNSLGNIDINTYFIISKDSPDYMRMKEYGKVVDALSMEHKVLLLLADIILTSQLNGYVENPYGQNEEYFRDLYHSARVVFLQHGITKDDQTKWLNRYNQNLYAIVSSSELERKSFCNCGYSYSTDKIWLTGMPRYDYIQEKTEKKILIMPTWRKKYMWQQLDNDAGVYQWKLEEEKFWQSEYFKQYYNLLHSAKLKNVCNKYGYKVIFMPHPIMQPYIDKFKAPDEITILDYNESWSCMFDECALMITDYSSVAFDFAYRCKPVIYYQFDKEEFFESHSYREGYFDYRTMGFGEVITEEERLIEALAYYLKRKCKMETIFIDRLENFFEFHDNHNCKRIFDRLMEKHSKYNIRILESHIVRIEYHPVVGSLQFWDIYLENVFWGGKILFPLPVETENRNSLIGLYDLSDEEFMRTGEYAAKGDGKGTVGIYATADSKQLMFVMYSSRKQHYEKMIRFSHRNEKVRFTHKSLKLDFEGCFYSDFYNNAEVVSAKFVIDSNHSYIIPVQIESEKGNYISIHKELLLDSIIKQEAQINNPIHIEVRMKDGIVLNYNIGHKTKKKIPLKFYYVPIISKYYKNYALCVRGNIHQNYSLVIRKKEEVESNLMFQILESKVISYLFYHILGKYKVFHHKKPINLYYEKNSMKADEGTFEIFQLSLKHKTSRNYFVLDKNSECWEALSKHNNVIRKYSLRYYVLLYMAQHFISTETSSHLNVHRSINRYIRKTLLESKLIFLQHGVTYLKCQGEGSVFGRDKEGEPSFIAVGSQKEAEVVHNMLRIPIERCIVTGLPVFSTLVYEHISEKSTDIITIMLTWKQYEEYLLEDFERSTYFQNVCAIYNMLCKYFKPENIQIVPHPKVASQLCRTSIGASVWNKSVADALKSTKLLITDYSSTCYNAFYQGAAVIFYQPDLKIYEQEVGKLIPQEHEYIGYRVFLEEDLKELIQSSISKNGSIDLKKLRNQEFVNRYQKINKYHDGKNVKRIVDVLVDKGII